MDQPAIPFDLARMLLGNHPPFYLAEVAFRTILVLTYTLALLRWVGHRAIGQLSLVEFLLVIALGSAVGDALFYPDTPLAPALLAITLVVFFDKSLDWLAAHSPGFATFLTGKPIALVNDGVADMGALKAANFAVCELHENLRMRDVTNMGQVEHAYLETNGQVTVVKRPEGAPAPGLAIVPPLETLGDAAEAPVRSGDLACRTCGAVARGGGECRRCGSNAWLPATTGEGQPG